MYTMKKMFQLNFYITFQKIVGIIVFFYIMQTIINHVPYYKVRLYIYIKDYSITGRANVIFCAVGLR